MLNRARTRRRLVPRSPGQRGSLLAAAVAAALLAGGCTKKPVSQEDLVCKDCNLVIVSLTNLRKDHLPFYGYNRQTAPNVDRFMSDAIVFQNAFAPASWTLPVAGSLYAGLYPYAHGLMNRSEQPRLRDEVTTLFEVLKENGYKTAGFTGGTDYNRGYNLAQGFDHYVDEQNYPEFGILAEPRSSRGAYLGVEELLPLATQWIDEHRKDKVFVLVHGYDVHCPFWPRPPYDKMFDPGYQGEVDFRDCLWNFNQVQMTTREDGEPYWPVKTWFKKGKTYDVKLTARDVEHMVALYDGEIAQVDAQLSYLLGTLEELSRERDTIVVFMSEHGDLFGEHGRFMRGGALHGTFYDPVLNFPLVIRHPKVKGRRSVEALAQSTDFMPTMLELLGLKDPQATLRQGRSLVPAIVDGREINDVIAGASTYSSKVNAFWAGRSTIEFVRSKRWKLVREWVQTPDENAPVEEKRELFDVVADPGELHDVTSANPQVAAELQGRLDVMVKQWKESPLAAPQPVAGGVRSAEP